MNKMICWFLLVGLCGLIQATSAHAAVLDPSLVGWWKLDDGAGTTAVDSSGNGNDGVFYGAPKWVPGKIGRALEFNGTDAYVQVNRTIKDDFTMMGWINTATPGAAGSPVAAWQGSGLFWSDVGGVANDFIVAVYGTKLCFCCREDNTLSAKDVVTGDWVHVAVTRAVVGKQEKIAIYNNGNVDTEVPYDWIDPLDANPIISIGANPLNGRFYTGLIDDVRFYTRALDAEEVNMMTLGDPRALSPYPKDKATDVLRDTLISWSPGPDAKTHNVYLGTSFEDVNNAGLASPLLVSKGQEALTYTPTSLFDFGQTYYWRIDEINAPDKPGLTKGNVWSFTAETYGSAVTPIKATASSFSNALTGPEKTINGSGLTRDQHGTSASTMWLSKKAQTPVWIQYEFDQVYSLHQMWVWNQNQVSELDNGYGAKEVTIETSTDGTTWTALANVPQFADGTGEDAYEHNTTVDFGGVLAKFVRLNILSNWGGAKSSGLAEVRFFYVPLKAYEPTPVVGATGVAMDRVLNWRPGRKAASHEVYFGTDPNALTKVGTATGHTYSVASAGAEYDRTCYWKINEVNAAETWAGDVWSFSTVKYCVVEDFESYNDECKKVFYTWVDGAGVTTAAECGAVTLAGNGTGASVGNPSAPYAEKTIVYTGNQSMPLFFNNPGATSVSEATRTLAVPQDWVQSGVKTLVLYFQGKADNAAGQLYVKINNGKMVAYTGNAQALTLPVWKQWNIDLASVGGNLRSVNSLTIGVSGAGKGVVYIDDLILYRVAPAVVQPMDPGTTGLSAYYKMDGDMKDSSGKGYNGTLVNDPVFVDSTKAGFGQALLFDGVNDHVELPIGTLISTLDSATCATWVNFDNSNVNPWVRIFDFGTGQTAYMFLTPRTDTGGSMRFAITMNGSSNESTVNAPRTLLTGWHHVAVVIDGTAKTLLLSFDGQVVASGQTAVVPKDLGVTTQNWLGRSQYPDDGYFTGQLDEFRLYNRALSEGEVKYLAGDR